MTFLVCLPVEVLIPVSENTEEYSVRILYLYGYKGTFPHSYHTDTETSLCFISPQTERVHRFFVELHQLSRGSKYTCFCEVKLKTVELSCAEQKPRSSELYIHSLEINELCHLSWQGKHPLTLFPLLTCPLLSVFWQKTVHAFQALSLNCWHHKVSYVH